MLIYLDHNIYSKLFDSPQLYRFSLSDLPNYLKQNHFKLLVSEANLIEISRIGNNDKIKSIIVAIENSEKVYCGLHNHIQNAELDNFLNNFYGCHLQNKIIYRSILQIMNLTIPGYDLPLNVTLTDAIALHRKIRKITDELEKQWLLAAQTNQTYYRKVKTDQIPIDQQNKVEEQIFETSIKRKIGNRIDANELFSYILNNKKLFYERCPSIHIEDLVFEERYRNPQRNVQQQDYRDISHCISGMPFSDYFITDDKFLRQILKNIKIKFPMFSYPIKSFSEIDN